MTKPSDAEEIYYDSEGDPHQMFDADIEGVPYYRPVCGIDGEWWPCQAIREQL